MAEDRRTPKTKLVRRLAQIVSSDGVPVNAHGVEYGRGWEKCKEWVRRRVNVAEKVQERIWILEHRTAIGWQPSIDYSWPFKTRRAAKSKLKSIGKPKSQIYRIACYVRARRKHVSGR